METLVSRTGAVKVPRDIAKAAVARNGLTTIPNRRSGTRFRGFIVAITQRGLRDESVE